MISREPGVSELLPYILEFLMNNLSSTQNINQPKAYMVTLTCLLSILNNPFFYLDPYIHQVVTLVLSAVLINNNYTYNDIFITIKHYAIKLLKMLFIKFETKYPNFINQLLAILKDNIVPKKDAPNYLTVYGAIKVLLVYLISRA